MSADRRPPLRVVSVSLGSSRRDHEVEVEAAGRAFVLSRVGADGDLEVAADRIRKLDGEVDAIGLGGIDMYLEAAGVRYEVRDGIRLAECAVRTPVVDGSGVKATLERRAVEALVAEGVAGPGTPVLLVSALDRFGMAEAFTDAGCAVAFGDLMFTAGIPYPIESLEELSDLARRVLPQVSKLPFGMLYPTGSEQEKPPDPRFSSAYEQAEVIAGDFHFIRRHMPDRLDGKTVVTNTTTAADVEELRRRGVGRLVTTTPDMNGRSFGTNVIEGMAVAYRGLGREPLSPAQMEGALEELGVHPVSRRLEVGGDG